MEVFMFRKVSVAVLSSLIVLSGINAPVADASTKISNGVACSKANSTRTVNGYKYRCAKNPLVKNAKLTWLSFECMTAITRLNSAVRAQSNLTNQATELADLDIKYQEAQNRLAITTAELEKNRSLLAKYQEALKASTTNEDKNNWSEIVGKMAQAVVRLSANKTAQTTAVNKFKADRALLESAPEQYKANIADARASASLLCAKGF